MPDPRTPLNPAGRTAVAQLQRVLDINYKSALFLLNRTPFAMKDWPGAVSGAKVGAGCGTVEAGDGERTFLAVKRAEGKRLV